MCMLADRSEHVLMILQTLDLLEWGRKGVLRKLLTSYVALANRTGICILWNQFSWIASILLVRWDVISYILGHLEKEIWLYSPYSFRMLIRGWVVPMNSTKIEPLQNLMIQQECLNLPNQISIVKQI